jgi:peptidoglycan/xylan/chitin deacetylase (PgdA/CDA1 family)
VFDHHGCAPRGAAAESRLVPAAARPLILAYHAVSSSWSSPLAVTEEALSEHAAHLHRGGYCGLSMAEAERLRTDGGLPARSVVFTFDDGYRSTLRAADILERHGYAGTVFAVTSTTAGGCHLSWPGIEHELTAATAEQLEPLSWADLEALQARGWEVGSHTVSHALLTEVDDARLAAELADSRRAIAERLGACATLAYPYGLADARVAAAARGAGYLAACTLTGAHLVDEPFRRPRVGMTSADMGPRLRAKLSPLGVALRHSSAARTVRRLRARRDWLPTSGGAA